MQCVCSKNKFMYPKNFLKYTKKYIPETQDTVLQWRIFKIVIR